MTWEVKTTNPERAWAAVHYSGTEERRARAVYASVQDRLCEHATVTLWKSGKPIMSYTREMAGA